jgi:hypothetical protein
MLYNQILEYVIKQHKDHLIMYKYLIPRLSIGIMLGAGIMACSNSGNISNPSQTQNPQTYGGVNQPALTAYDLSDGKSFSGIIRLTTTNSGIIYLNSTESNQLFNLKGLVSNFNPQSANCLPTTSLSGNINSSVANPSATLSNCTVSGNNLTATLQINATGGNPIIYNSISLGAIDIESTNQFTTSVNNLRATDPVNYNLVEILYGNFTTIISGIAYNSGNSAFFGGLSLGQLMTMLSSQSGAAMDIAGGTATATMIDSTSINFTLTNVSIESSPAANLQCNVLFTNLIVNGSPYHYFNGFVTGCATNVSVPSLGQVQNITGTISGQ